MKVFASFRTASQKLPLLEPLYDFPPVDGVPLAVVGVPDDAAVVGDEVDAVFDEEPHAAALIPTSATMISSFRARMRIS